MHWVPQKPWLIPFKDRNSRFNRAKTGIFCVLTKKGLWFLTQQSVSNRPSQIEKNETAPRKPRFKKLTSIKILSRFSFLSRRRSYQVTITLKKNSQYWLTCMTFAFQHLIFVFLFNPARKSKSTEPFCKSLHSIWQ